MPLFQMPTFSNLNFYQMSIGQMVKLDPVNFSCIIPKESNLIIFNLEWKDSNTVLTIRIFLSEILLLKVHGFYGRYKNCKLIITNYHWKLIKNVLVLLIKKTGLNSVTKTLSINHYAWSRCLKNVLMRLI